MVDIKDLMTSDGDYVTDKDEEIKPYWVSSYHQPHRRESYDSLEEAEEAVDRILKRDPWGGEAYVYEVRKIARSVPEGGVTVQKVDVREYIKDKTGETDVDISGE